MARSRLRKSFSAVVSVFCLGLLAQLTPAATAAEAAEAAEVFTVHMSPRTDGGTDDNDGLSPDSGVITLKRVEEILREADPNTDVRVRIKQGVYYMDPYDWTFYIPGHTITFAPHDWNPGEPTSDIERPIIRNPGENGGSFPTGHWLHTRLPEDPSHPLYDGGDMGLRFYYLHVDCYSSAGLSIDGDTGRDIADESYDPPLRQPGSAGHNGNVIFGMKISRIGTVCAGINDTGGYAAVILTNSRNNRIENNHFVNLDDNVGRVHGLYITHFSSENSVTRNRFHGVTGQGVKIRNRSNHQDFSQNTFEKTGWHAYYYGQFCDLECVKRPEVTKPRECASYGNVFTENRLVSDANNGNTRVYRLDPPGQHHAGEQGCSIPADEQRVHAFGNT